MSDFHTEELSKCNFYPLILREISVLTELHLGRMRYRFTYEPPQPNSPSEIFLHQDLSPKRRSIGPRNAPQHANGNYERIKRKPRGEWAFTPHSQNSQQAPSRLFLLRWRRPTRERDWRSTFFDINARSKGRGRTAPPQFLCNAMREIMFKVEVFHCPPKGPSYATPPKSFLNSN